MDNFLVNTQNGVICFTSLAAAKDAAQRHHSAIYKVNFDNGEWVCVESSNDAYFDSFNRMYIAQFMTDKAEKDRLERFTLAAMQGLCASPLCNDIGQDTLVKWAVNLAQAQIKALDEVK